MKTIEQKSPIRGSIIILVFTLGFCFIQYTCPSIYLHIQFSVFFVLFFSIGVPHGAVDHLLESGHIDSQISYKYVLKYLAAFFSFFIFWKILPCVSLSFFILFSALHFGQADMKEWYPSETNVFKNLLWGGLVLGIIIFGHVTESNLILSNMQVQLIPFDNEQGEYVAFFLSLIAFAIALHHRNIAMSVCVSVLALSIHLPLLTSFGLYFLGQHSFYAWSHLKRGIYRENKALFIKAVPLTLGALALFFIILISMQINLLDFHDSRWITAFYVFISCVSFPHVLAMNAFYKKHF